MDLNKFNFYNIFGWGHYCDVPPTVETAGTENPVPSDEDCQNECMECGYIDALAFNERRRYRTAKGGRHRQNAYSVLWQGRDTANLGQYAVPGYGCNIICFNVDKETGKMQCFLRDINTGEDGELLWERSDIFADYDWDPDEYNWDNTWWYDPLWTCYQGLDHPYWCFHRNHDSIQDLGFHGLTWPFHVSEPHNGRFIVANFWAPAPLICLDSEFSGGPYIGLGTSQIHIQIRDLETGDLLSQGFEDTLFGYQNTEHYLWNWNSTHNGLNTRQFIPISDTEYIMAAGTFWGDPYSWYQLNTPTDAPWPGNTLSKAPVFYNKLNPNRTVQDIFEQYYDDHPDFPCSNYSSYVSMPTFETVAVYGDYPITNVVVIDNACYGIAYEYDAVEDPDTIGEFDEKVWDFTLNRTFLIKLDLTFDNFIYNGTDYFKTIPVLETIYEETSEFGNFNVNRTKYPECYAFPRMLQAHDGKLYSVAGNRLCRYIPSTQETLNIRTRPGLPRDVEWAFRIPHLIKPDARGTFDTITGGVIIDTFPGGDELEFSEYLVCEDSRDSHCVTCDDQKCFEGQQCYCHKGHSEECIDGECNCTCTRYFRDVDNCWDSPFEDCCVCPGGGTGRCKNGDCDCDEPGGCFDNGDELPDDTPCICPDGTDGYCEDGECKGCPGTPGGPGEPCTEGEGCSCDDGSPGECKFGVCIDDDSQPCCPDCCPDCGSDGCQGKAEGAGCECQDGSPGRCEFGICRNEEDGTACCAGCGPGCPGGLGQCDDDPWCDECDAECAGGIAAPPDGSPCECCDGSEGECQGGECQCECMPSKRGEACADGWCNGCRCVPCSEMPDRCDCFDGDFMSATVGGLSFCTDPSWPIDCQEDAIFDFSCGCANWGATINSCSYKCGQECESCETTPIIEVTPLQGVEICDEDDTPIEYAGSSCDGVSVGGVMKYCWDRCNVVKFKGICPGTGRHCIQVIEYEFGTCGGI